MTASVVVRGRFPAEEGALIVAALEAAQHGDSSRASTTREGADVVHGTRERRPMRARTFPRERRGRRRTARTFPRERLPIDERVPDVPRERPARTDARTRSPDVPAGTAAAGRATWRADRRSPTFPRERTPRKTSRSRTFPRERRALRRAARADALLTIADGYLTGARGAGTGDRYQVLVHVDAAALSGTENGGRCELDDGAPLAAQTARRLACDASIVRLLERDGKPLRIGRKTRSIPPAVRRALRTRDRGCRFPGCTARRFIDAHHIEHWAKRRHHRSRESRPTLQRPSPAPARRRLRHPAAGRRGPTFLRPDGRPIPTARLPAGRPARLRPTRPPTPACRSRTTGSTSNSPSTRCSPSRRSRRRATRGMNSRRATRHVRAQPSLRARRTTRAAPASADRASRATIGSRVAPDPSRPERDQHAVSSAPASRRTPPDVAGDVRRTRDSPARHPQPGLFRPARNARRTQRQANARCNGGPMSTF